MTTFRFDDRSRRITPGEAVVLVPAPASAQSAHISHYGWIQNQSSTYDATVLIEHVRAGGVIATRRVAINAGAEWEFTGEYVANGPEEHLRMKLETALTDGHWPEAYFSFAVHDRS